MRFKKNIISYDVYEFWEYLDYNKTREIEHIPLCKISDKPDYIKYYHIIFRAILRVQDKISNNMLNELTVYESIILTYLVELYISKRYSEITPMDLYNITDFFNNNECNKERELFDSIVNIRNIVNKCSIKKYQNINWNIFKFIELKCKNEYFRLHKTKFPIIGNNK